jgi:hypothetical protein
MVRECRYTNEGMNISTVQGTLPPLRGICSLNRFYRKGKDYTYLYGKHVGTGSLTPYIDSAFDPRVNE